MIDHFGLLAPIYERFIKPPDVSSLTDLLELPASGWLLDAGGGTGRISKALLAYHDKIVVADESIKMLRQVGNERIARTCGVSEALPFPDGFFDRILMVDAFHHLADQGESARELFRVLKPGGLLVIEEPDIRSFSVKLIALAEKLLLMRSHFRSGEQIAGLFPQTGLARVERVLSTVRVVVRK